MCLKLAYPWLNGRKDQWFYNKGPHDLYSELFDGSRWSDYSYFFDPTTPYLLPARCKNAKCSFIFSAQQLLEKQKEYGVLSEEEVNMQDHFPYFCLKSELSLEEALISSPSHN
jgi:hypothetical protein